MNDDYDICYGEREENFGCLELLLDCLILSNKILPKSRIDLAPNLFIGFGYILLYFESQASNKSISQLDRYHPINSFSQIHRENCCR